MKTNSHKDKLEKKSLKRFIKSFKYSYEGMKYAFYHEVNLLVMMLAAIVALSLGIILKISYEEKLIIVCLIGFILALEMINTAIEATVNLVTKEKNPLAKIAKDCASGAVGLASLFSLFIGLMIFLPKLIALFN